jgi:preprotein translocase subunit SecA
MIRKDEPDLVYLTQQDKYAAIVEDIRECVQRSQPVLVGTASIESSELLSGILQKQGIGHEVLNAKQHEREAHIIAQAGRPGAVTIATNMAGRGTDIVLGGNLKAELAERAARAAAEGKEFTAAEREQVQAEWQQRHDLVLAAGGLHIVGTERHESRRIDNQLRGRSGRQGDAGSSRFYLSMEDNLMRIFGDPNFTKRLLSAAGMKEGEVIESRMLTRRIEAAQRKVESHNFDIRKQLLLFDDVANDQRKVIYQQRTEIMAADNLARAIDGIRNDAVESLVEQFLPPSQPADNWNLDGLRDAIAKDFAVSVDPGGWMAAEPAIDDAQIRQRVLDAVTQAYEAKRTRYGTEVMQVVEKDIMLKMLDQHWREHLAGMDYLRQGIHLRGYAQKDYRYEYKREAYELFSTMLDRVKFDTASVLMRIELRSAEELDREEEERRQRLMRQLEAQHASAGSLLARGPDRVGAAAGAAPGPAAGAAAATFESQPTFVRSERKVGRNEPCPCGSGKKYKHCHGMVTA